MRTALVGCGGIAAVHAKVLSAMEGCEIVGFADIIPERAKKFADEYGGCAYASLEEMMEAQKPDILHICTPHYLHVPMAVYGLSCGAHVFMEKPPAITREQFVQLEKAAAEADKKLGICFQNRYNACVQALKQLLDLGVTGKVLGARAFVTWHREAPYYTESGWRGRLATEGGGVLINQSVHTLDLLVYLLGKADWVDASLANHHLQGVIEVEDTMEANIRFGDKTACFYATTGYCADEPPLIEFAWEKVKIRMEDPNLELIWPDGTRKLLKGDMLKNPAAAFENADSPAAKEQQAADFGKMPSILGKGYWGSGHGACIGGFYDAVSQNIPYAQEIEGIRDTAQLMLAMYESARNGYPVVPDGKE